MPTSYIKLQIENTKEIRRVSRKMGINNIMKLREMV